MPAEKDHGVNARARHYDPPRQRPAPRRRLLVGWRRPPCWVRIKRTTVYNMTANLTGTWSLLVRPAFRLHFRTSDGPMVGHRRATRRPHRLSAIYRQITRPSEGPYGGRRTRAGAFAEAQHLLLPRRGVGPPHSVGYRRGRCAATPTGWPRIRHHNCSVTTPCFGSHHWALPGA